MLAVNNNDVINQFAYFLGVIPELRIENKHPSTTIGGNANPVRGMEAVVKRDSTESSSRDSEIGFDVSILIALEIEYAIFGFEPQGTKRARELHDAPTDFTEGDVSFRSGQSDAIAILSHRARNKCPYIHRLS